ncbi:acylphosphatase-2-like [Rhynchophorus ferrugineus]|uniref:acylphosphatase n=1 Tax=Rhynchophorus ferrugineus TaxID=354439 RepID=A0A834IJU6_RHYFE|nr:hypothetical protein GWI33_005586 [Rhynchophorus ferrugineus]
MEDDKWKYKDSYVLFRQPFEIVGYLEETLFCEHAKGKADSLGIRGYCMDTEEGTVNGEIQGPTHLLSNMKIWLTRVGSPKAIIQYYYFAHKERINQFDFEDFVIFPGTPPKRKKWRWTKDFTHLHQ